MTTRLPDVAEKLRDNFFIADYCLLQVCMCLGYVCLYAGLFKKFYMDFVAEI